MKGARPMPLLDGFKVIPLKEKFDDSYLMISEKSLKLNRATAQTLGFPKQVVFLLNEKKMQIALMPAKSGEENAIDFSFDETGREKPIYVKEPAILKAIHKITNLERNGTKLTLTIKGMFYPDEKVILYALSEAIEEVVKPRGRRKKE